MLRAGFFVGEDNTNTSSSHPLDPLSLSHCFSVEFLLSDENGAVLFIGAASLRHNLDRTDPLLLPWPINALSLVSVLDVGSGGHSYLHFMTNVIQGSAKRCFLVGCDNSLPGSAWLKLSKQPRLLSIPVETARKHNAELDKVKEHPTTLWRQQSTNAVLLVKAAVAHVGVAPW